MAHRDGDRRELLAALGAAEYPLRAASTARTLGPAAVPMLIEAARHPDPVARAAAMAAMDHVADDRCAAALQGGLRDPVPDVRRHAVHAIGCQPCKMSPLALDVVALLIERALDDASVRVRPVATHLLGLQAPDPRAIRALRAIYRSAWDGKLRQRARLALVQLERLRGAVPRAMVPQS